MKYFTVISLLFLVKICSSLLKSSSSNEDVYKRVCIKEISHRSTRLVPFTETYKHKVFGLFYVTKRRRNYRVETTQLTSYEKTCCNGYIEMNDTCTPLCFPPCTNGKCVAPDICECIPHYEVSLRHSYLCVPSCGPEPCVHGTCESPNNCVCDEGYEERLESSMNGTEVRKCVAKCDGGCSNGDCLAPNVCRCHEKYQSRDNKTCEPICNETCINGRCAYPDVCVCDEGFAQEFGESPYQCYPVCHKACLHGNCTAPDTCTCDEGFALVSDEINQRCEPVCDVPCGPNGTCTEPNFCACDPGFQPTPLDQILYENETNRFACQAIPEIPSIASNGCITLNNCTWNNDTNVEYVAECTRNCSGRGICKIADQPCDCYNGWSGWNCDKPTMCSVTLNNNDENAKRILILSETNNTLTEYYHEWPTCRQCTDVINNETYCFKVSKNDTAETFTIKCLLSTELPCYEAYKDDFVKNGFKFGMILGAIIFIIVGSTAAAYVLYRYHRKKVSSDAKILHEVGKSLVTNEVMYYE